MRRRSALLVHGLQEMGQPFEVERLRHVVHRPELDRLDGAVDSRIPRHQDDFAARHGFLDRLEHLESVDVGHPEIHHGEVGRLAPQLFERLLATGAGDHVETGPPGESGDHVQNAFVVVDQKQKRMLRCHGLSRSGFSLCATFAHECADTVTGEGIGPAPGTLSRNARSPHR